MNPWTRAPIFSLLLAIAGTSFVEAQTATTVALLATQNAYIDQSSPTTNFPGNYGGQTTLMVSDASGAVNQAYLQYDLTNVVSVVSAKLRFFVDSNTASPGTTTTVSVYGVGGSTPNTWTETGITYSGAGSSWPANTGAGPLGMTIPVYPVTIGTSVANPTPMPPRYYEVDVTPSVQTALAGSKLISFVLANNSSAIMELDSLEGPRGPQLIITSASNAPVAASQSTFIDEQYQGSDFGHATSLQLKGNTGYRREDYLQFDLSSVTSVGVAKLRFYVNSVTANTTVYASKVGGLTPNSWIAYATSGYLDWTTASSWPVGAEQNSVGVSAANAYYEIDVTSLAASCAGGPMSVILTVPSDGTFTYIDSAAGTHVPQLIIGNNQGSWNPGAQDTNSGAAGATGTVYYIDNVNGNDANSGTSPSAAWGSLDKVNGYANSSQSLGGDAFLFCAGETFIATAGSTTTLVTQPGCNCGARVIYGSYDPEGLGNGRATIQAPGGGLVSLTQAIATSSWIEIRDLKVTGTSTDGSSVTCSSDNTNEEGQYLIAASNSSTAYPSQDVLIHNVTISGGAVGINAVSSTSVDESARWEIYDCTIENIGGTGIIAEGDNYVVRNCLFYDWGVGGETAHGGDWSLSQQAIYSHARQLEMYGNELYRASAVITSSQAVRLSGRDNVIEGNRIHDLPNQAFGFYPDSGSYSIYWGTGTSVISYNTFWNVGGAIFEAVNNGSYNMSEHWVAFNNTAHGIGTGNAVAFSWSPLTGGATSKNNAVTGTFTSDAPSGGGYVDANYEAGSALTLGIPDAPPSPSFTTQWVPTPGSGSILLNAGTASIDTGITIVNFTGSAPNIGSD